MKKALFSKRAKASITDSIVGGIIILPLTYLLCFLGVENSGLTGTERVIAVLSDHYSLAYIFVAVASLIYSLSEVIFAQTPGKWIHGIIITNVDGSPSPKGKLWVRWVLKCGSNFIKILPIYLGIQLGFLNHLGNLWGIILFGGLFRALGDSRQTLHDLIAKTAVFHCVEK